MECRKNRILVVDDDVHIVRLIEHVLKKAGYEVSVARDGEQALASLESFGPDAMVLDLGLPNVAGIDVLRAVRADPRHASTVVLVLTAKAFEGRVDEMRQSGADSFCSKPIGPSALLKKLGELGVAPEHAAVG